MVECDFRQAILHQIGKSSQGKEREGEGHSDSPDALTTLLTHFNMKSNSSSEDEEVAEARTKAATGTRSVGRKRKATANSSSGRPKKPRNSQAQDTPGDINYKTQNLTK